ncbi:MAG: hypothetical protein V1727_01155 [Candidatus Omnitrophota bacterium]
MHKKCPIFLVALGLALYSAAAFAQEPPEAGQGQCTMMCPPGTTQQGGMTGQQDPMMQMQSKRGMMERMQPKSMVATGDGGIVVLSGNSLLKYDQDLNLIKEVKIKSDLPLPSMNEMPAPASTEQTQQ